MSWRRPRRSSATPEPHQQRTKELKQILIARGISETIMLGALMGLTWRAGAWIVGAIGVVAYVIYVKSQDAIIDIFQEDIQEWLAEFKKLFKEE